MEKQYNLMSPTTAAAVRQLEEILYTQTHPPMTDIRSDDAFRLGFETAIYHLKEAMGFPPREVEVHTYRLVEEDDDIVFPTTHPE